jgi:hypothetical protein
MFVTPIGIGSTKYVLNISCGLLSGFGPTAKNQKATNNNGIINTGNTGITAPRKPLLFFNNEERIQTTGIAHINGPAKTWIVSFPTINHAITQVKKILETNNKSFATEYGIVITLGFIFIDIYLVGIRSVYEPFLG